jgi:glucose-1-phosphate adenylyltransferase
VYGKVRDSVLFNNATIEEGAEIKDSIVLSDCIIRKGAKVEYAILDSGAEICEGVTVSGPKGGDPIVISRGEKVTEDRTEGGAR